RGRRAPLRLPRLGLAAAAAAEQAGVQHVERRLVGDGETASDRDAPLLVLLGHEGERLAIELDGVILRPAALGLFARGHEIVERPDPVAGVAPVAGEGGARLPDLRCRLFEEARALLVPLLAACPRKEVVGHVADQHMFEHVLLVALDRRDALAADEVPPRERRAQARAL